MTTFAQTTGWFRSVGPFLEQHHGLVTLGCAALSISTALLGFHMVAVDATQGGDAFLMTLVLLLSTLGVVVLLFFGTFGSRMRLSAGFKLGAMLSIVWWVFALSFIVSAGPTYIVKEGQVRIDSAGIIYRAGDVAPRGIFSYETARVPTHLMFSLHSESEDAEDKSPRMSVSTDAVYSVLLTDGDALYQKARRLVARGVPIQDVEAAISKEIQDELAATQYTVTAATVADMKSGTLYRLSNLPWVNRYAIAELSQSVTVRE